MVTDAMLQKAAVEAEQAFLTAVTDLDKPSHEFSKPFERKIKSLICKAKHPALHQVLRYAAIIILTIGLLFGAMMAFSPEVRAGVVGWFRMAFDGPYAHYSNEDVQNIPNAAAEMEYDYYLPTIPDGYELMFESGDPLGNGSTCIYVCDSGAMLTFSYHYAIGVGDSFLNVEGYMHERVKVGVLDADLYTTTEEGQNNVIVWYSKHGGVIFVINGDFSGQQLIALAESVQHQKTPMETKP